MCIYRYTHQYACINIYNPVWLSALIFLWMYIYFSVKSVYFWKKKKTCIRIFCYNCFYWDLVAFLIFWHHLFYCYIVWCMELTVHLITKISLSLSLKPYVPDWLILLFYRLLVLSFYSPDFSLISFSLAYFIFLLTLCPINNICVVYFSVSISVFWCLFYLEMRKLSPFIFQ